jgi:hypothetical protein
METLKIELKNKKQSSMIKELLKELNIQFKSITYDKEEDPYDPEFIAKIKRGEKARKEGRGG